MGPAIEMEGKSDIMMEISATKQNDGSVFQCHEDTLMPCVSNIEDNTFHMGALFDGETKVQNRSEDVGVNITNCTKSIDHVLVEAECNDATENCSSFGDTISGTEDGSTIGDVEVDSPFCGGNGLASVFDAVLPMRNKKLSNHWRRFVHPIMWRCKWAELQIKEFQSQALKYDRELAKYDQKKQFEFEKSTLEGYDVTSLPFSCQNGVNQVMKRKKRKRVEETTDLASYLSHHNLFSYYEYKRSVVYGASVDNDAGNLDTNHNDNFEFEDRWTSLESREGDNSLEQILWKIEVAQSEVHKLKTRINKVVSENPGKFTSVNRLSLLVPCDALTGSDRATSPKNVNGMLDRSQYISSQHISECNMRNLFMPESTVSSHREVNPFADMIESIGLPQVGVSCENIEEANLMDNQTSEEELYNFERVISQFTENPHVPMSSLEALPPVMAPEADLPVNMSVPDGQPSSSRSNVRNNKRKWGRQKSCTGKWSRRSSG
ncbi:hypothetical protein Dsin_009941 [Dipteronia sinensis]|uniref:Uncharacterized protein n=1 Tax=Dipteronia sinensis TaxID=43782 RepID=A0AAE0ARJ6_9ROSI|nr:hypothetical protein Dsin_009941 [Dipteronia sinensis]